MLEIRPLTIQDAHAYWAQRMEALTLVPEAFAASPEEFAKTPAAQLSASYFEDPEIGKFMMGVFVDGILCGSAGFSRARAMKLKHVGDIWGVYVSGEYRGQGLGKKLLEAVIERAKTQPGLRQITLGVSPRTPVAKKLYESLGFVTFGIQPGANLIGDEYVDEHYMVLLLHD